MRKYKILVLTNSTTGAHGAVLKNTFGKRPYTKIRATKTELILTYDDAEIMIKHYNGGSLDNMRGYRWDEVWFDEYITNGKTKEEDESIVNTIIYKTRVYHIEQLKKEFPHYWKRKAINYFNKSDDGYE